MAVKKRKLTFVIHISLKNDLSERVIKDGYGFRGKSLWVTEAIISLLNLSNFTELVSLNENMSCFEKTETIVVNLEMKRLLDDAIIDIRRDFPALDGVQSGIIRTAIIQRLLRT